MESDEETLADEDRLEIADTTNSELFSEPSNRRASRRDAKSCVSPLR
jgi:hypothetical protein